MDGNARRVLCRVHDLVDASPARLERFAREWIDIADGDAGMLNQALMDLGGSVCLPRGPLCEACPLADACLARRRGTIALRPARRRRPPLPHHDIAAAIIWRGPRLLIARRPEKGLLGGLWEFPGGKMEAGETPQEAARREVREELGMNVEILAPVDEVRHAYSHFRITLHLFHACWISGEPSASPEARPRWVLPEELNRYAFPAANHRVIERLVRGEERPPQSRPGPA